MTSQSLADQSIQSGLHEYGSPNLNVLAIRDGVEPMGQSNTRLRVLVVEDCRDTAETLRYLMGTWGHDVCLAKNGSAAVAMAPAFRPNVVLIDIGLPGPDGFEVARRMTRITGMNPPVLVAATGFDGSEIRRDAQDVGFDHFLSKPFDLGLLRSILSGARSSVTTDN